MEVLVADDAGRATWEWVVGQCLDGAQDARDGFRMDLSQVLVDRRAQAHVK